MKAMIFGMMMMASVAAQAKLFCSVNGKTSEGIYNEVLAQDSSDNGELTLKVGERSYFANNHDGRLNLASVEDYKLQHASSGKAAQDLSIFEIQQDRVFYCVNQ